jgi:hypothetical protein
LVHIGRAVPDEGFELYQPENEGEYFNSPPRNTMRFVSELGLWFAVPLRSSGYGVGVIAFCSPPSPIILAYLFGPRRTTIPSIGEVKSLRPSEAAVVCRVGDAGLRNGSWPMLGVDPGFDDAEWAVPRFVQIEPITGRALIVHYDQSNVAKEVSRHPTESAPVDLPRDGLLGYGAAEIRLTKVLEHSMLDSHR